MRLSRNEWHAIAYCVITLVMLVGLALLNVMIGG